MACYVGVNLTILAIQSMRLRDKNQVVHFTVSNFYSFNFDLKHSEKWFAQNFRVRRTLVEHKTQNVFRTMNKIADGEKYLLYR